MTSLWALLKSNEDNLVSETWAKINKFLVEKVGKNVLGNNKLEEWVEKSDSEAAKLVKEGKLSLPSISIGDASDTVDISTITMLILLILLLP